MTTLRGKSKDKVFYVAATPYIMYGWKTYDLASNSGISDADLKDDLGLVDGASMTLEANKIYVIRANAPKPSRVTKKLSDVPGGETGSVNSSLAVTTFCAYDKVGTALSKGWSLARQGRGVSITGVQDGQGRQKTALIPIAGGFYAFPADRVTYSQHGEILGYQEPGTTGSQLDKAFSGTSSPKPGNARLKTQNGTFSSYYDEAKKDELMAAGWRLSLPIAGIMPAAGDDSGDTP
ncbi:MAG: hypothetical protein F6K48_15900 [Okeania sp. SIO3H1]|nr:hypothetical protein [Okeania sp. SIO3H1]